MLIHKTIYGFVTQVIDTDSKRVVEQSFTAGNECQHELPDGTTVDPCKLEIDDVNQPVTLVPVGRPEPTQFVAIITVTDPDTKSPVELEIRKTAGGYMVGIDGSYLEQDIGPVYDPFNLGVELDIPDDET